MDGPGLRRGVGAGGAEQQDDAADGDLVAVDELGRREDTLAPTFTPWLLLGAGLLFASFEKVAQVDPGFRAERVLTASITLPAARYPDADALRGFTGEALRRVRSLPGVVAAGLTDTIPCGLNSNDSVILAEGYAMRPGESVISPNAVEVSPGYFEAMGARLERGRFFADGDAAKATPVIIVDHGHRSGA